MTNEVLELAKVTPEQVQSTFNAWSAVLVVSGGTAWHVILKIAPWAKANGGLFRGVISFFWAPKPTIPAELNTPNPINK